LLARSAKLGCRLGQSYQHPRLVQRSDPVPGQRGQQRAARENAMRPPPPERMCVLCLKLRPLVRASGRDGQMITQISYFQPHRSRLSLPHLLTVLLALTVSCPTASLPRPRLTCFLSFLIYHLACRCAFVSTCLSVRLCLANQLYSGLTSESEFRHFIAANREIKDWESETEGLLARRCSGDQTSTLMHKQQLGWDEPEEFNFS